MKIVDFSNVVLGRAASRTAKLLLKGESVVVVNAEKAVVRGTRSGILEKFVRRYGWTAKGNPNEKGPNMSRLPERLVRYSIKHMLPVEKTSGQRAFERLKVFSGIPLQVEGKPAEQWKEFANQEKKNFLSMNEISEALGLIKR